MGDWALFWFLLFVSAVLVLSWALFLAGSERRRERDAKLMWKRMYFDRDPDPDVSEPHDSGSDRG